MYLKYVFLTEAMFVELKERWAENNFFYVMDKFQLFRRNFRLERKSYLITII